MDERHTTLQEENLKMLNEGQKSLVLTQWEKRQHDDCERGR
jgi:hypothetical protein